MEGVKNKENVMEPKTEANPEKGKTKDDNNNVDGDAVKPTETVTRIKKRDIFIGNLSLYTTEDKLRIYFARYGPVEDVRIMYHPETRRSRR